MKKIYRFNLFALCFLLLSISSQFSWADYSTHPEFIKYAQKIENQYEFKHEDMLSWFTQAEKQDAIIAAISKPAENSKTWGEYRKIFITPQRIEAGLKFWKTHQETLNTASQTYKVPPSIIVAIIGVETFYGRNTGKYRVIDALSTLAFDYPPRADFFRSELTEFLLLARENHLNPMEITGSYAGAIGYAQFIPSSYRHYAIDTNNDHTIDLHNPEDAIGSIANYFQKHNWKPEAMVVIPAKVLEDKNIPPTYQAEKPSLEREHLNMIGIYPQESSISLPPTELTAIIALQGEQKMEYWLGLNNFYVITRYNRSPLYAMAVYQLSQALEEGMQHPVVQPPQYIFHKYQHI